MEKWSFCTLSQSCQVCREQYIIICLRSHSGREALHSKRSHLIYPMAFNNGFKITFIYLVYICMYVQGCVCCKVSTEVNLWEHMLPFLCVGPGGYTQVLWLDSQNVYQLNYLTCLVINNCHGTVSHNHCSSNYWLPCHTYVTSDTSAVETQDTCRSQCQEAHVYQTSKLWWPHLELKSSETWPQLYLF